MASPQLIAVSEDVLTARRIPLAEVISFPETGLRVDFQQWLSPWVFKAIIPLKYTFFPLSDHLNIWIIFYEFHSCQWAMEIQLWCFGCEFSLTWVLTNILKQTDCPVSLSDNLYEKVLLWPLQPIRSTSQNLPKWLY